MNDPRNEKTDSVNIQHAVHVVRGQQVMLDSYLASLFDVSVDRLQRHLTQKRARFPQDLAFELTSQEIAKLRSKQVIPNAARVGKRLKYWAFTEAGVAMLSSIIDSPIAVQVNIDIMRKSVE
jgi:hypothetical protein